MKRKYCYRTMFLSVAEEAQAILYCMGIIPDVTIENGYYVITFVTYPEVYTSFFGRLALNCHFITENGE